MADETPSTSALPGGQATTPLPAASETVKADANAAADQLGRDARHLADEASHEAAHLADEAKARAGEAGEAMKNMASEQKDYLAGQIGGVADAMERVADDLERNNASSAHYARLIASNAERLSNTVRQKSFEDMAGMAQDFGRRQPVAFLGAAALLGFAASRFMVASSHRQQPAATTATPRRDARPATPQPYDSTAGRDAGLETGRTQ